MSAPIEGTIVPRIRGLSCVVGRMRLAVPIDAVEQVVDLEATPPPPLAKPWVGGIAFHDDRLVVVVSLAGAFATIAKRKTEVRTETTIVSAIILNSAREDAVYALQIDHTGKFLDAEIVRQQRVRSGTDQLPTWICAARSIDGQGMGWLEPDAMLDALLGVTISDAPENGGEK